MCVAAQPGSDLVRLPFAGGLCRPVPWHHSALWVPRHIMDKQMVSAIPRRSQTVEVNTFNANQRRKGRRSDAPNLPAPGGVRAQCVPHLTLRSPFAVAPASPDALSPPCGPTATHLFSKCRCASEQTARKKENALGHALLLVLHCVRCALEA